MQEINENLLINMNSLMDYKIIEYLAVFFSDTPIFFLPIFLVIMWIYYTHKQKNENKKKNLLFIFYSTIIGIIISYIIKSFVSIDRPETVLEGVGKLVLDHIPDASFPSDHATVSIAFLVSLFFAGYKKTGMVFFLPVILMNLSRVTVGVHWPFDILMGTIVGVISSIISFKILKKVKIIDIINNNIIKLMSYIKL